MTRPHTTQMQKLAPAYRASRGGTRSGGRPVRIPGRATVLMVCAVVGAIGLTACSKATSSGSVPGTSGAFGTVLPASGPPHAGTITWGVAWHGADLDLPGD